MMRFKGVGDATLSGSFLCSVLRWQHRQCDVCNQGGCSCSDHVKTNAMMLFKPW